MNFNQVRTIQKSAVMGGLTAEVEVERAISALKKKINPYILAIGDDVANKTVLLSAIDKELGALQELEKKELAYYINIAYNYSLEKTIQADYGKYIINTSLAIGYNSNWLNDGKTAQMRATANITATIAEIHGLVLGFQDSDPIVLMGLIHDILNKALNEYKRLIRTELEAAYTQGARDAFLMEGCAYAIIENSNPCDRICSSRVGAHRVSLHGELGIELPPYHPNCQCIFLGVFVK